MKKLQRRDFREKSQPLVMIIPMIDIMLFLLVFFMLSTIYMVQTNNFEVNLPQSESKQSESKPDTVSITVMSGGNILYNDETITGNELAKKVRQKILSNAETVFVLLGDKSVQYEKVVAVLELLKKSGAKKISIATEIKK